MLVVVAGEGHQPPVGRNGWLVVGAVAALRLGALGGAVGVGAVDQRVAVVVDGVGAVTGLGTGRIADAVRVGAVDESVGVAVPMGTPDATVAAVVRGLGGPLKPLPGVQL